MFYKTENNDHGMDHDPFKAIVTPRPIGWIGSVDKHGVANLAPHSYFNAISDNPYFVIFGSIYQLAFLLDDFVAVFVLNYIQQNH